MGRRLTIGTRSQGDGGRYEGVLRDGKTVVLTCGCWHHNRDTSTQANGQSARHCIWNLIRSARYPQIAADTAAAIRRSAESYLRSWGSTAGQAARMREAAARDAEAFLARLPGVAAIIGNEPVFGYTGHVDVAPVPPQGVTCRHCGTPLTPGNYAAGKGWVNWKDANRDWWCPTADASHKPAEEA